MTAPPTAPATAPPPMPTRPLRRVAVIGAGPRGIAVIERLVAAASTPAWQGPVEVHLVDPHVEEGGAVWRAGQSEVLLMNTATCQTTMYPDPSCRPALPVPRTGTLADFLADDGLRPADIAPRAAHGRYLVDVLRRALADADPTRLRIVLHATSARDVSGEADAPQRVTLENGTALEVDAVVLALGHLATELSPRSRRICELAERHGLVHLPSANPLNVPYERLLGRERVAVQGMGLNFYDLVGMLTERAGGRFEEDPTSPSGLRYIPGGGEPQLVVGSRSGMIYRPKPDVRPQLPEPYEPRVLTEERLAELIARDGGLDHEADTLPLMLDELVLALREAGFAELADPDRVLELLFPFGRRARAIEDAHERTRDVLRAALRAAARPDPAWVLVFRVLGSLRIQVNRLADVGAYTPGSYTRDVDGFLKNAFASWASGPPVLRVRQVIALEEAGLVRFTGPGFDLGFDEDARRFTVHAGEGPRYRCDAVIEAHLPGVDLELYRSPLIARWRERDEIRHAILPALHGDAGVPTGSIDVAARYAPIGMDGTIHERRIMLGVPVSAAQPGSAITAEPGTAPQLLRGAEEAALRLARWAGAWESDPEESAGGDVRDEDDVPWAMQIVVRRDRHLPIPEVDVCECAARAAVALLDDPRSAPGGPWHESVERWRDGAIRKLVRRADGKRWDDVQAVPGVSIEADHDAAAPAAPAAPVAPAAPDAPDALAAPGAPEAADRPVASAVPDSPALSTGRAAARAIVPGPARPLPPALDKLQVGGTSFPAEAPSRTEDAIVVIEVSPLITLTSGKKAAQCAHAAQRAYERMDTVTRERWRQDGFRVRVEHPDRAAWDAVGADGRPVSIVDAGFTELDGPTETTRARW